MVRTSTAAHGKGAPADEVARLALQASQLDTAAFGDLYRLYASDVLGYMRSRVPRSQEAEDLANTVFEKAFAALDHYEPSPAGFSTWLYTIAHNLVVDYYRKRRLPLLDVGETEPQPGADTRQNPEDLLLEDEQRHRLYKAILELTDEQRVVIGCRFFYNLPVREVAELVGKTEGAVKALQFRALKKLHRQLAPEWGA